MGLVTIEEFDS